MPRLKIQVLAAGTGGHIYPALSFSKAAITAGHGVSWIGTATGMESRVVPVQSGLPITYQTIKVEGIRGRGIRAKILAPLNILGALFQSLQCIREFNPDLVVGFGGYVAGPAGVAARLMRKPLIIHEQNAVAGKTNQLLSRVASRVLSAFSSDLPKAEIVGNPVRDEILRGQNHKTASSSEEKIANLLVVGGSLGAQFLNAAIPQVVSQLSKESRLHIRHQTGQKLYEEALDAYRNAQIEADVVPYIEDMAEAYRWADIVICRSGAMTVSELAMSGTPSILVPYPYAVDDHQTANARFLVDVGGAELYQQSEQNLNRLRGLLEELLNNVEKRIAMAQRAREQARPDAAQRILKICEEVAYAV